MSAIVLTDDEGRRYEWDGERLIAFDGGCPGHKRHWFSLYGRVGVRSTTCVRCGAPNPKPVMPEQLVEDGHLAVWDGESTTILHREQS